MVPVTVVPVVRGDVAEAVDLIGDVAAPERARLAFERAGRLSELAIRLGDVVKKGDVLARLDDAVMHEEIRAADAALAQSRTMAELAARDAARARELKDVDQSAASLDRVDAVAMSEAALVAQMEADLALKHARLTQGTLLAPFNAVVTARPVALGDYVAAGDVCCELLSLERREILLEIPSAVVGALEPGAAVVLTSDALPGFELAANLSAILPSAEPRARTFQGVVRIDATTDSAHRLQPGLFIRARTLLHAAKQARVVPIDALLEGPDGVRLAMVVPAKAPGEPPTAAFVAVTVLARDALHAAVSPAGDAHLEAGDAVILIGKENVTAGALLLLPAAGGGGIDGAGGAASGKGGGS